EAEGFELREDTVEGGGVGERTGEHRLGSLVLRRQRRQRRQEGGAEVAVDPDRPAYWSTPEARITWAGREHGPAGLGAGGPDPVPISAFKLARNDVATAFVQR